MRTKHAHLDRHWHIDPSVRWTVHECYVFHQVADRIDMHHSGLHYTQLSTELATGPQQADACIVPISHQYRQLLIAQIDNVTLCS